MSTILAHSADNERQMSQITPGHVRQTLMNSLNYIRWALVTGEGYLKDPVNGGSKKLTGHTPQDVFKSVADKTKSVFAEKSRHFIRKLNELSSRQMFSNNYTEAIDCCTKLLSTLIDYDSKVKAVGFVPLETPSDMKLNETQLRQL